MKRRTFIRSTAQGPCWRSRSPLLRNRRRHVPVIGYLIERSGPTPFDEAFRRGLRELGYPEGRNIVVEYRWAGRETRAPSGARSRAREDEGRRDSSRRERRVDWRQRIRRPPIPIVLVSGGDFVADGLVASFARPGGNITGVSVFARELSGKRLEILKEAIPGMTRVGAAFNALNPGARVAVRADGSRRRQVGVDGAATGLPDSRTASNSAFAEAVRLRASAVVVISDGATIGHRAQLESAHSDTICRRSSPTRHTWRAGA